MCHYNENKVFFQGLSLKRNNVFTYMWMKLPDCAFNIDVKSAFTFWDPIVFWELRRVKEGGGDKKTPSIFRIILVNYLFTVSLFFRRWRLRFAVLVIRNLWIQYLYAVVTCACAIVVLKSNGWGEGWESVHSAEIPYKVSSTSKTTAITLN